MVGALCARFVLFCVSGFLHLAISNLHLSFQGTLAVTPLPSASVLTASCCLSSPATPPALPPLTDPPLLATFSTSPLEPQRKLQVEVFLFCQQLTPPLQKSFSFLNPVTPLVATLSFSFPYPFQLFLHEAHCLSTTI